MIRGARWILPAIVRCWAFLPCICSAVARSPSRRGFASCSRPFRSCIPCNVPLGEPREGDWRSIHDEPRETFRDYIASDPVTPDAMRDTIYVRPLGDFTKSEGAVIEATAEFLAVYFQLPVTLFDAWPASAVPGGARRHHPEWGTEQILTGYVVDELLYPELPEDAAAYIAITASDLWPGEGWNFVFGEASPDDRVGIWSIARYDDPGDGPDAFRRCLLHTISTAGHEVGHMFSMGHCTLYECNMCGSETLEEAERYPLHLCPECVAKVCWATSCDLLERYRQLAALLQRARSERRSSVLRTLDPRVGG